MKMTGLPYLFKWENLHNWGLTKLFFALLYIYIWHLGGGLWTGPQIIVLCVFLMFLGRACIQKHSTYENIIYPNYCLQQQPSSNRP
jgi:4-hydroxybenzoate polyprenyltransferase